MQPSKNGQLPRRHRRRLEDSDPEDEDEELPEEDQNELLPVEDSGRELSSERDDDWHGISLGYAAAARLATTSRTRSKSRVLSKKARAPNRSAIWRYGSDE